MVFYFKDKTTPYQYKYEDSKEELESYEIDPRQFIDPGSCTGDVILESGEDRLGWLETMTR